VLAAVIAAAAALEASTSAQERAPFTVGVLRPDGALLPFAAWDGRRWDVPWPSDERHAIPISVSDIPKKWWGPVGPRRAWTAWLTDGGSRAVHLTGVRRMPVFCSTRTALLTDYRGEIAPPGEPTVPKDGIAIAGDVLVHEIARVSPQSPDWGATAVRLLPAFNDAEDAAIRTFRGWRHPFPDDERHARPIDIEAIYRTRVDEGLVSYIEVVRAYPPRAEDAGCGLITFVSGWVLEHGEREPHYELQGRIAYCDRNDVTFMQPLVWVQPDRDVYWIYQLSSWRDEAYAVTRVAADKIEEEVLYSGGWCPAAEK
jgi:hypothetical protein